MVCDDAALPRLYVDFNNADPAGRIRLNSMGTIQDLHVQKFRLASDAELILHDDGDLEAVGVVVWSEDEKIWVAELAGV